MKRFLILSTLVLVVSSFCKKDNYYPCHPAGDVYPCLHRIHAFDYDYYGNTYPCDHARHRYHVYPCTHICY